MTGILSAGLATELLALGLVALVAVSVSVVASVRTVVDESRSPGALLLGPLVLLWGALVVGLVLRAGWDEGDPEGLQLRAVSHGAAHFLLPLLMAPAGAIVVGTVAWLGSRPPRTWTRGMAVGMPLTVAAGILLVVGRNLWLFTGVRAGTLLLVGSVLTAGSLRQDPRGRALQATALALCALLVAVLEACYNGLVTLLLVGQVRNVEAGRWGEIMPAMLDAVWGIWAGGFAAFAVVAIPAVWLTLRGREHRLTVAVVAAIATGGLLLALASPTVPMLERLGVLHPEVGAATSR